MVGGRWLSRFLAGSLNNILSHLLPMDRDRYPRGVW